MQKIHSVSVRALAEFAFEKGDLIPAAQAASRMRDGVRGHQILQSMLPFSWEPEVSVSRDIAVDGRVLRVHGRADAVYIDSTVVRVQEIKTTTRNPDGILKYDYLAHWAQGEIYAALFCMNEGVSRAEVRLTYARLDGAKREYTEEYDAAELEERLVVYAKNYLDWICVVDGWKEASAPTLEALTFPFEQYRDGQREMALVIELVESLPEHFKIEHIACILAGESNAMIKSYRHDSLELFGAGKDHDTRFWAAVIHQGLILHFLDKDIENYGLIRETDAGLEFLLHPHELMLVEDRTFSDGTDDEDEADTAAMRGGGGGDQVLLAMLKDLRRDVARKLRLQPWIIFSDPSLEDMSILYPVTLDELKNCQGVGEGKARKYGKAFVDLIARYVAENEIERPDDFIVKSVAPKSGNKVYIIQSIDRKLGLEDIAAAKGLDMDDLLGEIEAIVASGTRLDLNYYIDDTLDEEVVDEIYDWFREEAGSESLEDALNALGSDYEEREIRLVRLKFLCEVAN